MYKKIPLKGLDNEEWLELRKSGIGGSDAGAICGLNPYSSPMKVFLDKTAETIIDKNSEAIRIGHDLEQYVADRFMEATGLKVRRSNYMYRNVQYPFMIANVDRFVVGEDAGLECKTASAYNADKWENGDIPLHYAIQCYHYMAVTGKRTWYIAVVILGKKFTYRKLTWDGDFIQQLIAAEEYFWKHHVKKNILPSPDGSKSCDMVLEKYFHATGKTDAVKLVGFDEKLKRRDEIIASVEKLQTEQKKIEQEVKLFMQEHELAIGGNYKVSWSNVDTTRLDTKRIKQEAPELYQKYASVSSSRRFTVRAA